jgi:hypothetical protein
MWVKFDGKSIIFNLYNVDDIVGEISVFDSSRKCYNNNAGVDKQAMGIAWPGHYWIVREFKCSGILTLQVSSLIFPKTIETKGNRNRQQH